MTVDTVPCRICGSNSAQVFSATILKKYRVAYFLCQRCRFLQTEEPYWLEESYQMPINLSDTGILGRALYLAEITAILIHFFYDKSGRFLDFAGGYGLFTRRMRDIGFDFVWDDKYSPNLMAQGFEMKDASGGFELVTSFESFEHFPDPVNELEKLLELSESVLFTTDLLPDPVPGPTDWYYYGLEHGQHISFFSVESLGYLAKRYRLNLYTIGNVHLFRREPWRDGLLRLLVRLQRYGLFRYVSFRARSLMVPDSQFLQKIADNEVGGDYDKADRKRVV